MDWMIPAGAAVWVIFLIWTASVNYRLGVNDGYMYSKDPTCPGYRRARRILERLGKISAEQAKSGHPDGPAPR
jgi:hypothetical protein